MGYAWLTPFLLIDLLLAFDFRPPSPPILGEHIIKSPPILGSQCGLGVSPSRAPGVDLGGFPGFMQEV